MPSFNHAIALRKVLLADLCAPSEGVDRHPLRALRKVLIDDL